MPHDPHEEPNPSEQALDNLMTALSGPTGAGGTGDAEARTGRSDMSLSPVLVQIRPGRRPSPMPVCGACPKSVWWATAKKLECYCRLMHARTWTSEDPEPIETCDGFLTRED